MGSVRKPAASKGNANWCQNYLCLAGLPRYLISRRFLSFTAYILSASNIIAPVLRRRAARCRCRECSNGSIVGSSPAYSATTGTGGSFDLFIPPNPNYQLASGAVVRP